MTERDEALAKVGAALDVLARRLQLWNDPGEMEVLNEFLEALRILSRPILPSSGEVAKALEQCAKWFQEYADSHREQGKLDKARRNQDRADFARAALASTEARAVIEPDETRWLGELLAVIHRDGGQYRATHGTAKAVVDAHKILAGLFHAPAIDDCCQRCDGTGDDPDSTLNKRIACRSCGGNGARKDDPS